MTGRKGEQAYLSALESHGTVPTPRSFCLRKGHGMGLHPPCFMAVQGAVYGLSHMG